jgi:hypothetical protein
MKVLIPILSLVLLAAAYAEDMQKYLQTTQDLVAQGKHEEALKRFVWFHAHALEHDQSMYGVRLSFALSYWKRLGESYPPAMQALVKMRDDNSKLLRETSGSKNLFHDVIAINRTLEEAGKTVELFEFISKGDPVRAEQYWIVVKATILEQKRYDLARKYIKDFGSEFVGIKEGYDLNVALYDNPQIGGARFKKYNEDNFVTEVRKLIDLALALNDRDAAVGVRDSALAVIDDERLKGLIPEQKTQQDGGGKPADRPESK